jgi:methionyl-tRNA synthetase
MLAKYRNGVVPAGGDTPLDQAGRTAVQQYARAMDALDLRGGAEAAWSLVATANLYIQQVAPWALAKAGDDAALDSALGALGRALYRLAVLAGPFIPGKAQRLWQSLGLPGDPARADWEGLEAPPAAGLATTKPEVLFPKPATA